MKKRTHTVYSMGSLFILWDAYGNLVQFTVEAGSEWKYFRIQCEGISADSVITVNELIE